MNEKKDPSNFDLLDFEAPLQNLLGKAIKTEMEEAEIYRDLLKQELIEGTRSTITRFVEQEEEHEEKLRGTFNDFFPDEQIPIPEGSWIEIPSDASRQPAPKEIIEKAIEAEKEAEQFYKSLMEEFDDEEVRRTLGFLAANEREHYEILKEEFNKLD